MASAANYCKQINKVLKDNGYSSMYCQFEDGQYYVYCRIHGRRIFNLSDEPSNCIERFLDIWIHFSDLL